MPLLVATGLIASAASGQSAGVIGKRHTSATYNHMWVESDAFDDADGFSAFTNLPLSSSTKFDLGLGYNRLEKSSARIGRPDITTEDFQVFGTLIGPTIESTPYLRVGLGWANWSASDGNETDGAIYSISAGAEMFETANTVITPYLTWTDSFNGEIDGALTYGACFEWSPSESFGIVVRLEGDDHYDFSAGVGAVLRF